MLSSNPNLSKMFPNNPWNLTRLILNRNLFTEIEKITKLIKVEFIF